MFVLREQAGIKKVNGIDRAAAELGKMLRISDHVKFEGVHIHAIVASFTWTF